MIAELITSYCKKNKVTVIAYLCVVMLGVFSSFFLIPKYSSALMSSFTTGQKAKNLLIVDARNIFWEVNNLNIVVGKNGF